MRMTGVAVVMLVLMTIAGLDADEVEHDRSDASLGPDAVGKLPQGNRISFQHHAFKTATVIKRDRSCTGNQIVMGVLHFGQPACQSAHPPVVNIRQVCHTMRVRRVFTVVAAHCLADDVTHALRSALIAGRF